MNESTKLTAEVLPHLQARKMLQKLGCRHVVVPKIRTTGKTGNMVPGMCHDNVAELVARCGGKHLTGYSVIKRGQSDTQITLHSIWETPEGEFAEVTKLQNGAFRDTSLFAIIYESGPGEPFKLPPLLTNKLFSENTIHIIQSDLSQPAPSIPWNRLKSKMKRFSSLKTFDHSVRNQGYWEYQQKLQNCWEQIA